MDCTSHASIPKYLLEIERKNKEIFPMFHLWHASFLSFSARNNFCSQRVLWTSHIYVPTLIRNEPSKACLEWPLQKSFNVNWNTHTHVLSSFSSFYCWWTIHFLFYSLWQTRQANSQRKKKNTSNYHYFFFISWKQCVYSQCIKV